MHHFKNFDIKFKKILVLIIIITREFKVERSNSTLIFDQWNAHQISRPFTPFNIFTLNKINVLLRNFVYTYFVVIWVKERSGLNHSQNSFYMIKIIKLYLSEASSKTEKGCHLGSFFRNPGI